MFGAVEILPLDRRNKMPTMNQWDFFLPQGKYHENNKGSDEGKILFLKTKDKKY